MTTLCDMHTHSHHSFDAKNSVDEMCRAAIGRGLAAMAVTDHCEAPFIRFGADCEFGCFDEQIPASFAAATAARERYAGRLRVLRGMELGEPMHDRSATEHALGYGDFDFVLASVHNLKNMQDFYYMNYSGVDIPWLLGRYFDELCETAAFAHFDSLSHLTYPLRYIVAGTGKMPDNAPCPTKLWCAVSASWAESISPSAPTPTAPTWSAGESNRASPSPSVQAFQGMLSTKSISRFSLI